MFVYAEVQFCSHKFMKELLRPGLLHSWVKRGLWDLSKRGCCHLKRVVATLQRHSKIKA